MLHQGLVIELVTSTNTATYLAGIGGAPNRIYPHVIPQQRPGGGAQMPCVVYETRSVERQVTYCGTSGLIRTRMQLNIYSPRYDDAKIVAAAVRGVLIDFSGLLGGITEVKHAALDSEFDIQDIEPGLYRVSQSWGFWHVE